MPVVIFDLVVVGRPCECFYFWREFAVAEGRGEVVATNEDFLVSTVYPAIKD